MAGRVTLYEAEVIFHAGDVVYCISRYIIFDFAADAACQVASRLITSVTPCREYAASSAAFAACQPLRRAFCQRRHAFAVFATLY